MDSSAIEAIKFELEKEENIEIHKNLTQRSARHVSEVYKRGSHLLAILLALDFLDYKDNLLHIMLVNKEWKHKLEKKIYKKALSGPDEKMTMKYRQQVWRSILQLVIEIYYISPY